MQILGSNNPVALFLKQENLAAKMSPKAAYISKPLNGGLPGRASLGVWFVLVLMLAVPMIDLTRAHSVHAEQDLEKLGQMMASETSDVTVKDIESIIKNFGQHIQESMKGDLNSYIDKIEVTKKNVNTEELERLRDANEAMSQNAKVRIELAATENEGQFTQSSSAEGSTSFMSQVSGKLRSVGLFLNNQMSTVMVLAPKIKSKLKTIPAKLKRLLHWPDFLRYKIRFNKVYTSKMEELYRQMVYLKTQTVVGTQQIKYLTGSQTHLLKATQFADMTGKEFQQTYLNVEAETENDKSLGTKIDATSLAKLQQLALEDRNVLGQKMSVELSRAKHLGHTGSHEKRLKRSANELDDEDEEDEDELMMDAQSDFYSDGLLKNEISDDNSMAVDEYAAEFSDDADTSSLDELENIMDEALDSTTQSKFVPIDLRDTGCVIAPENQNGCGACYAYATTMSAIYFNCMSSPSRKPERYNARFISDCGRYMWPEGATIHLNGCRSGKLSHAIAFAKTAGHYPFMRYEVARVSFDFKSDYCAFPRPESIESWAPVELSWFRRTKVVYLPDLEAVDLHLRTIGPVFVNIRTWKNFENQGLGIYGEQEDSDNPIIHSMIIVGHNKDKHGRDYFILWNSHGTAWSELGFVRIYSESLDYFKVFYAGYLEV